MTAKVLNMRFAVREEPMPERHTLDRLMLALKFISMNAPLADTLLLVDRQMNVLYQNEAAIKIIGDKVGEKCPDLGTIKTPDGKARHLDVTSNPVFDESGRTIGSIRIGRDVTRLKEKEDEKKTALSMLSHDLKSPLTAIQGYVELLLDKKGAVMDEDGVMLQSIKKSSLKLLSLVEDFLTLSQIEAGRISLEPRAVNLLGLVESHMEEFRAVAEKRHIRLHKDVPHDLPAAFLDERHSGRVVSNLLHNALKYCGDGGGIWFRAGAAKDNTGKVFLEISDDGPGIPEKDLPLLFEKYNTGAMHGDRHGTGLGLAIVKALTELQGGTVEARCGEGTGTTIKLTLPAAIPPAN